MSHREKISWAWFGLLGLCQVAFALNGKWEAWAVVTVGQLVNWKVR